MPDEPTAARWFQAASPVTVQVWVVLHAGHTQGLATAPRAWETHVISFLNTALRPNATAAAEEPVTAASRAADGARMPGKDDLRCNLASSVRPGPSAGAYERAGRRMG